MVDHTTGSEDSHLVWEWLGSQSNNCFICRACLKEGGRRGREEGREEGEEEGEKGGGGRRERRGREEGEEREGGRAERKGREEEEGGGGGKREREGGGKWKQRNRREDGREEWGGRWEGGKVERENAYHMWEHRHQHSEPLTEQVHTCAITPATVLTTFRWEQGGFMLRSDRGSKDRHR